MMISDKTLREFLAMTHPSTMAPTKPAFIGNQGERLVQWQIQFNNLSLLEMYNQYKQIVNQLMVAEMEEPQRLKHMADVLKVVELLIARLHQIYQNQMGFLDEKQQQALDMVLSIRYLAVMFYHSVWQRVATMPDIPEKKGWASLLGINRNFSPNDEIIRYCLHAMMGLLKEALFEKHVGYRKDTQLIWQYLNACYHFANRHGWQQRAAVDIATSPFVAKLITDIYQQCLFAESLNPYSLRRPDILHLQSLVATWSKWMNVSSDPVKSPFLFVNLQSNEPPQLLHAGMAFNPFDDCETCLFMTFERVQRELSVLAQQSTSDANAKARGRLAKLALDGLDTNLKPDAQMQLVQENSQAVIGFAVIHYMLANKTSLGNLIQAHALPERLRPRQTNNASNLNKSTTIQVIGTAAHHQLLQYQYQYHGFEFVGNFQGMRSVEANPINQLQVKSLIALRKPQDVSKTWYLAKILSLQQTPKPAEDDSQDTPYLSLDIQAKVVIIGSHLVPCGVRIQNDDHRPLNFVAGIIIPNNADNPHQKTSLMMARFGYQVNDKLIIRIDNKEVNVKLTELLRITDDIEEYAFVRVQ